MKRILFVTFIGAFVLAACGAAATQEFRSRGIVNYGAPAGNAPQESLAMPEAPAQPELYAGEADQSAQGGGNAATVERVVLKNADVAIVVKDVEQRLKEIGAMAEEMGGHVVSSNLYQAYTSSYAEVPEATIVIRVPEARLDEALERIKNGTVEVQSETRSGKDVTSEYVDLQSRLKNLEAAEAQLTEIMEEAKKTEDVIAVFNQLVYYREQIELVKGQINYYDEASALSAVSVRLIAQETVEPIKIGPWTPSGAYAEAVQDLVYFLQDFAEFLIRFFIFNLPVLILVGIPLYLVFVGLRAIFRRTRKPKTVQAEKAKK